MFYQKDPYVYKEYLTLTNGNDQNDEPIRIGTLYLEYEVTLYDDVQLTSTLAVDQPKNQQFIIKCTKRITINNSNSGNLATGENNSYNNYPALLNTIISVDQTNVDNVNIQLLDYSPQTVNTAVNVSGSTGGSTGSTTGTSNSSTVGSSTSETNSYGTSVSVGMTGASPTASTTASYDHSSTYTSEKSKTTGNDSSKSKINDSSNSESMSVKDWGAYGYVNPNNKMPYWTFGQEVPWNAVKCRLSNNTSYDGTKVGNSQDYNQIGIVIPNTMAATLYDGTCLYPASELSMFGLNFVTKASWLVTINNTDSDELTFEHDINYYSASHILVDTGTQDQDSKQEIFEVNVFRDKTPANLGVLDNESLSTSISLNTMALDPLGINNNAAIIGFIPNKFIVVPTNTSPAKFKIIATTNDLMIQDTSTYASGTNSGFSTSQTALNASFTESCTSLQLTLYFKIIDTVTEYNLHLKHWITGSEGVKLTLIINDDSDNTITKYVDAKEAEGGENNLLSIGLRNLDFASVEYHDYLQLGLNAIKMSIEPIDPDNYASCVYQIRATSIEKN